MFYYGIFMSSAENICDVHCDVHFGKNNSKKKARYASLP